MLSIHQRNYKAVKAADAEAAADATAATGSRVKSGRGESTPEDDTVVGMLENMVNTPDVLKTM